MVHVPELGRSATAARLTQVEAVARGLVTVFTEDDPETYRVVVDLRVRHSVNELVTAAAALREQPDRVSVEAVTLRRGLARRLAAEGFDVRDVGALLGLSYGRTLQLVGEQHAGARVSRLGLDTSGPSTPPGDLIAAPGPSADDVDPSARVKAHSSFRHEAFLYRGPEQFLAGAVPFVREALTLAQPVMVALAPERLELLRAALSDVLQIRSTPSGTAVRVLSWLDAAAA